jgi:hypothetical protein
MYVYIAISRVQCIRMGTFHNKHALGKTRSESFTSGWFQIGRLRPLRYFPSSGLQGFDTDYAIKQAERYVKTAQVDSVKVCMHLLMDVALCACFRMYTRIMCVCEHKMARSQ